VCDIWTYRQGLCAVRQFDTVTYAFLYVPITSSRHGTWTERTTDLTRLSRRMSNRFTSQDGIAKWPIPSSEETCSGCASFVCFGSKYRHNLHDLPFHDLPFGNNSTPCLAVVDPKLTQASTKFRDRQTQLPFMEDCSKLGTDGDPRIILTGSLL